MEVQKEKDEAKYILLGNIKDSVLSTLTKDEFQLKSESYYWFSGNITKEGFEKLLNDGRVKKIYAKKEFKLASNNTFNTPLSYIILILVIGVLVILLIKLKRERQWKTKRKH